MVISVWTSSKMKRNNIEEMHKQFFILVRMLTKDGHDPLAIAGCMLAGAVQIYQKELGMETTQTLLDQIANGSDAWGDELEDDEETRH
tara:strand:- start:29 stop:292 length:264 start_codon:yes stop_codon:yes gene_type:complete